MRKKINSIRIAHYNVFYGGKGQLNNISKVIREINPDICGILEAVEWQNKRKYFEDMAKSLGYKFFDIAIANTRHNIAIFSKIPITITSIQKGFRHVALKAVIKSGPFKNLTIFFLHLSPVSEDARLLEIKNLFNNIDKFPKKTIIMGDLNSLSSRDPYNQKKFLEILKRDNIVKYGNDKLRFDVIKKIESLNLIDASNYLEYPFTASAPTPSNQDINHMANIRIDYAFLTKDIIKHLHKVEIFKNKIADKASDHYPLFIDLDA